ncbi:MAG: hypothetical protein ACRD33_10900, partial [Candidatus Acidiferrales bacterium]
MSSFRNTHAVQIFLAGWLACAAFITIPVARAQSATTSGEKDLTVERIYSEPSLNGETLRGVEWAPDGKRLSYFRSAHDGRDLTVVDAKTGQSRVLMAAEKLASL